MFKQYKDSCRQELTLPVDWDIVDASNGFTFDMGGSVMKIVFVDKKDWIEPDKRKQGSQCNLRMVNFNRNDLDNALKFILDRAYIPKSPDGSKLHVYSTGFGGSQFADQIQAKLHVQNDQLLELDCFNSSFMYLINNLPRKEVVHPVCRPAFERIIKQAAIVKEMMEKMAGKSEILDTMVEGTANVSTEYEQLNEKDLDKPLSADKDLFPCAIMMCGSAFGFSIVEADGSNRIVNGTPRGGKMFLGLGSLLAQTNSYEELIDLCAKGNGLNVSTSANQAMEGVQSTGENDAYGAWSAMEGNAELEEINFCFGQADGKRISDFKREDLARCVLDTMLNDVSHLVFESALSHNIKHVFFCGGFVNHPLVRQELTFHWLNAGQDYTMMDSRAYEQGEKHIHFLLHAQSLGAIGAMLNHKLKWSEKSQEQQ